LKRTLIIILIFILQINLYSCSQSLENVQVFVSTEDLQVGTNRFSLAVADKNGLVNSENLELNFSGEGGYPKFKKDFKFIKFPDYYDTDINNGIYTEIIDFEKSGFWKLEIGDTELEFKVNELSNSLNVGDLAKRSNNKTINETEVENLTTGIPPMNIEFYQNKITDLLNEKKQFILSIMSPAFCTDPTCGPQMETLNEIRKEYSRIPIVHVDTYSNPKEVKSSFENRELNLIIDEWGLDEGQWLFIISDSGMIIAKFQGYASFDQITEYLN